MAKQSYSELEQDVEYLTTQNVGKEAEIWLLQSEYQDTMKPIELLAEQSNLILNMIDEYLDHFKNRTETDANKKSKQRLHRLLIINTELGSISSSNQTLKLINKNLTTSMLKHQKTIRELNQELIKQQNIENF